MILGQLNDIDVKLLRVFRQIVECGGMSAAELELNISRSVISRQLKDLEIRLGGLHLCDRGRGGFSITHEGQHVYNSILKLQVAMDSFRSEVNDLHQKMTGNLVVALGDLTMTNPEARISAAIQQFTTLAPDVSLELHAQSLNAIEPYVIEGTYHIGIVPLHRSSTILDYHPLFTEKMRMYCAGTHPLFGQDHTSLDWDKVRQYPYAGLGYHSPNQELTRTRELKRMATAYDQESIATLIQSGKYIGFLPDHYAKIFVEDGSMQQINNATFQYDVQYSAIIKRSTAMSRSLQILLQCLIDAHQGEPG
jgi:DNA-binding transcriptional LysR family regulator